MNMCLNDVIFNRNLSNASNIEEHLLACDDSFKPRLSSYVKIKEYSRKIFDNAIRFEAWSDNKIVGLLACYFNDPQKKCGHITNVSTLKDFAGKGVGGRLLKECINYAENNGFVSIGLEVFCDNMAAISLYKKNGFFLDGKVGDKYKMRRRIIKWQ